MNAITPTHAARALHHPASYSAHWLHGPDRAYRETNCYTDVIIELLHSRGLDPLAGLGHLVRTDFEGDQFTFFKMPPSDMETLYGLDVHEMQPVGALPDQIALQLEHGRTMLVELDSFYLPDTASTDYRRNHVKSTVAIEAIDRAGERLHYFHNVGLHELSGERLSRDFRARWPSAADASALSRGRPVRCRRPLRGEALKRAARECLAFHLARRPSDNPFERFGRQLAADLPTLLERDSDAFHAYAFATVRMAGSAFDLLRAHVTWLMGEDRARSLDPIVEGCQILSFRLARRRAVRSGPRDLRNGGGVGCGDVGSRTRGPLMRIAVGGWTPGAVAFGDGVDASFATTLEASVDGILRFDGIATLATVLIDGEAVAESSSMWVPVEVPLAAGSHAIEVRCRALAPELAVSRKPRARWRQKVAYDGNLRWFRTTLNGRAPGFAPGPPVVGLWRPVWFIADEPVLRVRTRVEGDVGVVTVLTDLPEGTRVRVAGVSAVVAGGKAELRVPSPTLWWPHTHGEPHLYELTVDRHDISAARRFPDARFARRHPPRRLAAAGQRSRPVRSRCRLDPGPGRRGPIDAGSGARPRAQCGSDSGHHGL